VARESKMADKIRIFINGNINSRKFDRMALIINMIRNMKKLSHQLMDTGEISFPATLTESSRILKKTLEIIARTNQFMKVQSTKKCISK
jgi:hypothetical protein